ncbi:MAG: hypothetical protein RLZZ398_806 [Verrucomicrobiota bacterium]
MHRRHRRTVAKSEFTYDPATLAVDTEVISYNLDANLLATVTGPIHTVINQWEPKRDVLDTKARAFGWKF